MLGCIKRGGAVEAATACRGIGTFPTWNLWLLTLVQTLYLCFRAYPDLFILSFFQAEQPQFDGNAFQWVSYWQRAVCNALLDWVLLTAALLLITLGAGDDAER